MVNNINSKKRKNCNLKFLDLLNDQIAEKIKRDKKELNVDNIITYLIKHNIIRQSIVHRFVIIHAYPEYLENYGSKEKAVKQIAKDFPLETKAIYSILANHYAYFHPNNIDF